MIFMKGGHMKILVTGGAGFIGSNFIRHILRRYPGYHVVNLDALTYAGNRENLRDVEAEPRYRFIHGDIRDAETVLDALKDIDIVVNFAAETHVDRSIADPQPFLATNVIGLQVLLNCVRNRSVRFIHISTDEVYGSLAADEGAFTEESPLRPSSPYSASKAAGDLMAHAYMTTFGFPTVIVRLSNVYGPFQHPEKFIPKVITNLLNMVRVPVYGDGTNVRQWLFVEDACTAIDTVMHRGIPGEIYNAGGGSEKRNIDVVRDVLSLMGLPGEYFELVPDRPGHDYRYAIDSSKIKSAFGWTPNVDFTTGLEKTILWYCKEVIGGWLSEERKRN